jgi:hypothetical protein
MWIDSEFMLVPLIVGSACMPDEGKADLSPVKAVLNGRAHLCRAAPLCYLLPMGGTG